MQVQLNTDNTIPHDDELARDVEATVEGAVGRFGDRITRVEVHLQDVNSHKGGADDIRCLMEARVAGVRPVAVSHNAASVRQALQGAADKLERALGSTLGKLGNR